MTSTVIISYTWSQFQTILLLYCSMTQPKVAISLALLWPSCRRKSKARHHQNTVQNVTSECWCVTGQNGTGGDSESLEAEDSRFKIL